MHTPTILAGAAGSLALLAAAGCSGGARPGLRIPLETTESTVTADEVPPAAMAALRRLSGGATLSSLEREDRGDHVAWEAEWSIGDLEAEATVLADGSVVEAARELDEAEWGTVPPAVRARIDALRAEGWTVGVARRDVVVWELDAFRGLPDGPDADDLAEEREILLRPDGEDAAP